MPNDIEATLKAADAALRRRRKLASFRGPLHVGVDLGTAYTVVMVLDGRMQPMAGAYQFAQVVRDGVVVDFIGAIDLLKQLKSQVEAKLGVELTAAASAYPPGVPLAEVQAVRYVLEGAGLACATLIDEPTAANALLNVQNGAVVDVGGGSTGIAVIEDGQVTYTADEPTGGAHFTLVIAGAKGVSFEEAEALKLDPDAQMGLFSTIRPVMEKVATIIQRHLTDRNVQHITLVGGAAAFPRFAEVVTDVTGIPTIVPSRPLFVTPIGIAMNHES
jgi:ethanolamine utilization protein EutJ